MNNTFEFSRFLVLLKKHFAENIRLYLMSLLVLGALTGIMFLYLQFEGKGNLTPKAQFNLYSFFLLLAGSIFTSTAYTNFSEKNQAISSLMLPASQFEKYLVGWVYTVLVFPLIYTGIFYTLNIAILSAVPDVSLAERLVNVFSTTPANYFIFIMYMFLNSVALLGAIYFEKLHFIKTAFIFFVAGFILITLNAYFIRSMIPEKINTVMLFNNIHFKQENNGWQMLQLKEAIKNVYLISTPLVLSLLLWVAAYFKIKEKQV